MPFDRFIGIDYSGAKTPDQGLKGIRVFESNGGGLPRQVLTSEPGRINWSRKGLAHWLVRQLEAGDRTMVGIDHGFSFPMKYFERHRLAPGWDEFLDDFVAHWPTADDHTYVDFVREGECGNAAARQGNSRWRRVTEEWCGAKSVFHFDVQGSVAKSTFAGLPWLRHIRRAVGARVHFWPFDGFDVPNDRSLVVEVYPALWPLPAPGDLTNDQRDAWRVAHAMQVAQADGALEAWLHPELPEPIRAVAGTEGWIFGLMEPKVRSAGTRSHRDANPLRTILDAVIAEKGSRWSAETRRVAAGDAMRILEALVAEYAVDGAIAALQAQGFAGEAYSYLLKPLHAEAVRRRMKRTAE